MRALKVDASFVKDIGLDLQSETIIKATIGLTKSLGLDIIAEGGETRSQAEFFSKMGVASCKGGFTIVRLTRSPWLNRCLSFARLHRRLLFRCRVRKNDFL